MPRTKEPKPDRFRTTAHQTDPDLAKRSSLCQQHLCRSPGSGTPFTGDSSDPRNDESWLCHGSAAQAQQWAPSAMAASKMRLPNLPACDPENLRLDKETLEIHTASNARQIEMGYMPGVAECAIKDNRLIYVDIRGYQDSATDFGSFQFWPKHVPPPQWCSFPQ